MHQRLVIAGLALFALAACSADEADFKDSAEDFIESDTVEEQARTTFSDASCIEPESTDTGSTFTCTAVDADDVTWDFDVEITGDDEFNVVGGTPRA